MAFGTHLTEFAGLPAFGYRSPQGTAAEEEWARERPYAPAWTADPLALLAALRAPGSVAWRLDDPHGAEAPVGGGVPGYLDRFLSDTDPGAVAAVITGDFYPSDSTGDTSPVREALVEHAARLTGLRALFHADVVSGECEVSWLRNGDLAPLLDALPSLERLAVRGTGDMSLAVGRHASLRSLTLEGGGLPADLARDVLSADYPALEHLELWLGVEDYGGDASVDDLAPLLEGRVHTGVRSLGLRNAQRTDTWVRALAESPLLDRLESLDLSGGTLGDLGAQTLLDTPGFRELERLDLHHHYMSEETERRVLEAFTAAGVAVDASGRREPEESHFEAAEDMEDEEWAYYYYPSVTE
ncbi:hypothetical protein SAMN05421803_103329 [Nocardiopsis flavescens]|uniref:STM4015 family protein n=1 Tax=Nocardiopsis flavescens TaxID=758803 RepID=A0A1M6G9S9_9ACTN|nr:STM4015 family protein [Nocardiopsis flavescens]SHJ06703.1 hypothetical protein SAMN05421803_103329 [Nocardiopsis flavescens]